jgi:hypothetical protein
MASPASEARAEGAWVPVGPTEDPDLISVTPVACGGRIFERQAQTDK